MAKPIKVDAAQHRKSSPQHLALISDEQADSVEREGALGLVASDGLFEAEPQIAALLTHPEALLRGKALYVLLGWWKKQEYLETAVRMLASDPDWLARTDAASALTQFARRSADPQVREVIIRELVRALYAEADDTVQPAIYEDLQELLLPHAGRQDASFPFDREHHVDKALIAPYTTAEGKATG